MIRDYSTGRFVEQTVSYESLMKKRVKKHSSFLQPIFEAVSNSLRLLKGEMTPLSLAWQGGGSVAEKKAEARRLLTE